MKWFRRTGDEEWARERLDAFVDGELSPGERARFERILAASAALAEEVQLRRNAKLAVRALPRPLAPRSFALTPAMAAAVRPEAPRRAPDRSAWARLSAAGSALAAAVFVFTLGASLVTTADEGSDGDHSVAMSAEAPGAVTKAADATSGGVAQAQPEAQAGGAGGSALPADPTPAATTETTDAARSSQAPPQDQPAPGETLAFDAGENDDDSPALSTLVLVASAGLAVVLGLLAVGLHARREGA